MQQLLPPGICEAFFAGFCPVPNCPLRHETEIPETPDATPPPSQPQPAAAAVTDTPMDTPMPNGSPPLETMEGVTAAADDADAPRPFSEGNGSASHPASIATNAASESINAGEEVVQARRKRKVCKRYVQDGFCENEDCTLIHPEDDENVNMEDLVEEEEDTVQLQQESAPPVVPIVLSSLQGEMLPDCTENTPNGPRPQSPEITVRPDRTTHTSTDNNDIGIDDLPSEPDEELELSPKKRSPSPSPSPDAATPKRSKHDTPPPKNNTPDTPGTVVVKPSPSPDTPAPVTPLSRPNPNTPALRGKEEMGLNDHENLNSHRVIDINNYIPPSQAGNLYGHEHYHRASPDRYRRNGRGRGRGRGHGRGRGRGSGRGNRNRRTGAPMNATQELQLPIPREDHPPMEKKEDLYCKVCSMDTGSPANFKAHIVSKKHLQKVRNASFNEDNAKLQDAYRTQEGKGVLADKEPSADMSVWGIPQPAEEEPVENDTNDDANAAGPSYLATMQSSTNDDENDQDGKNKTDDDDKEFHEDEDASDVEPVSDPSTPLLQPVFTDDTDEDSPPSPKPEPATSSRVPVSVAPIASKRVQMQDSSTDRPPPRASSPPLPAELQSPRYPLSFDVDESENDGLVNNERRDVNDRSNNRPPAEPQVPSTNTNIDTKMKVDLPPLMDSPPATLMQDVVSPRSVSEDTSVPTPPASGGKVSPTKSRTAPNVGVVDAAVTSIERSHSEQNGNGRAPATAPKSNRSVVDAAKPEFSSNGADSEKPKAARGSRFTRAPTEADNSQYQANGQKEDQEMPDAHMPVNGGDAMETDSGDGTVNVSGNVNGNMEVDNAEAGDALNAEVYEEGELIEDPFNPPKQSLEQVHVFPNVFEPSEASEAPTIGSMNALRNIAMKGDRANQLAFKIMQEFLISPNLGIGQQHLKPFMRAMQKVPQYISEDGVPFSYWQHFHPTLIGATLTPEQEYQYSVMDGEEEKAIESVSDNLAYLLHQTGTIDQSSEFMTVEKGKIETRGRWPTSKHQFGVDDVTKDPLFHVLRARR